MPAGSFEEGLQQLAMMGFERGVASAALSRAQGDVAAAVEMLSAARPSSSS